MVSRPPGDVRGSWLGDRPATRSDQTARLVRSLPLTAGRGEAGPTVRTKEVPNCARSLPFGDAGRNSNQRSHDALLSEGFGPLPHAAVYQARGADRTA